MGGGFTWLFNDKCPTSLVSILLGRDDLLFVPFLVMLLPYTF